MAWLLECYSGKTAERRQAIFSRAAQFWGAVECRLLGHPNITARQALLLMEETVVAELRAQRLDLLARAKFAKDGEQIAESRQLMSEDYEVNQQVTYLGDMAGDGIMEVA